MSIRVVIGAVSAACDTCKRDFKVRDLWPSVGPTESAPLYFDSEGEAMDILSDQGWHVDEDGSVGCPDCPS